MLDIKVCSSLLRKAIWISVLISNCTYGPVHIDRKWIGRVSSLHVWWISTHHMALNSLSLPLHYTPIELLLLIIFRFFYNSSFLCLDNSNFFLNKIHWLEQTLNMLPFFLLFSLVTQCWLYQNLRCSTYIDSMICNLNIGIILRGLIMVIWKKLKVNSEWCLKRRW